MFVLNEESQSESQKMKRFSERLMESKNWAIQHAMEENSSKLGQSRANYQEHYKEALDIFKSMNVTPNKDIQEVLERVDARIKTFSEVAENAFQQHQDRLSSAKERMSKINHFIDLVWEIDQNLKILENHSNSNADVVKRVKNLRKIILNSHGFFSSPLFSIEKKQPEERMKKVVMEIRKSFEEGIEIFDQRVKDLFPLLASEHQQYLHKARTLSISFRKLVLLDRSILELYENEIPKLAATWKAIEELNFIFDELQKEEKQISILSSRSLHTVNKALKTSQNENKVGMLLLMILVALLGTGILTAGKLSDQTKESAGEGGKIKELELKIKELEAAKSNETARGVKSNFLVNMSHEFRTQLGCIIGFSELILADKKQTLDERGQKNLKNVVRGGRDLLALMNSILELAKINADRAPLKKTEFDLIDLIKNTVSDHTALLKDKNVELISDLPDVFPVCCSDPIKIKQIINNLLDNAIKFTEKGEISVSLERQDKFFAVHVKDTGIGIAKEDQEIIFDEFTQAHGTASKAYPGSGLGLAIVKKIVGMLDGDIKLSSELNEGSCFTLILPIDREQATA